MAELSMTDLDRHVGFRIRLLRTATGVTQKQLADALGVSVRQVQKYEDGTNRIPAGKLWKIRALIGCDIRDFFTGLPDSSADTSDADTEVASWIRRIENPEVRRQVLLLVKSLNERS